MPRPLAFPPLRNWQDFEDLCLDLWRRLWKDTHALKNGRQGQPQAGVDIYGQPEGTREWAGVQCKRLEADLTPRVIEEEVEKARTFVPPLSRFVIATTARSDVHCQKAARKITETGFPVTVVSWDEICHHLEGYPELIRKYFPALIESSPSSYRCMAIRPEGFVEREELEEIRQILCKSGASAVGITSALRGAGGFGKTTLAQALCEDHRVRVAYPDGILWTTIGDQASDADRLSRILDLIRFWKEADPPHFDTVTAAAAHLRETLTGRGVLIVVDDAWNAADVQPFRGAGAGLLVTTRLRETLPDGCAYVDVDAMRLGEAVRLLTTELPGAEGLRPRFEDLARTLGEWPLLLKLVNRTLQELVREEGLGVDKALDEIGEALASVGLEAFDQRDNAEREKAVSRTLEVSLRRLSEAERLKFEALAVFPEDEDVPLKIVERLWSCSAFETKQLARRLHRLSLLLDLNLDAGTLRLHDVLRKYLIGGQGKAIAALHQDLLACNRPASGCWADLPTSESYLWRWLPYHLVHAGQSESLRNLLLDIRFLAVRLYAMDVSVVIAGFDYLPGDSRLRTVQSAIRISAHILVRHPEQLAGQLLGRLPESSEERENTEWERLKQEACAAGKELLPCGASLLPRRASLTPAGGPLLRTFEGHTDWVWALVVVGEGRALSGSGDRTLRLWDLVTGACLRTFEGHTAGVRALAAAGEGCALSGSNDGTLRLWDLRTGACLRILEGHTDPVRVMVAVGEGRALSGSDDQTLRLWDLATGACLRTFGGHIGGVTALAAVGEGRALSGSGDRRLRLWDLATGVCLRTFERQSGGITALVAVGEERALSGTGDRTLRLWDLATGACLRTFEGHTGGVGALALVGEGRALSGSGDRTLRLWDLVTGACLRTFEGHTDWVRAVAAVGEGQALSGSGDRTLRLWDLGTGAYLRTVEGHTDAVWAVTAVGEGRALSGSGDRTLRLSDLKTGACLRTFEGHTDVVWAVAAVGEGRALSGSGDRTLRLWDLGTGVCLHTFNGHSGWVWAVAAVGEGRTLSGSSDRTLRLWNLVTGACLRIFKGHSGGVTAVTTAGEGRALSGSDDRTLRLWNLVTGACLRTFEGHISGVTAVAAVGEERALSGSDDGTLRLWDLETGACLHTLEGHIGGVTAVGAVGERRALSGSDDGTLRLWDLATGASLAVFTFDHPVFAVAVLNGIVIVGDNGGNVHFLDLILPDSNPA